MSPKPEDIELARRNYKFGLEPGPGRCDSCANIVGFPSPYCVRLDIIVANPAASSCPVYCASLQEREDMIRREALELSMARDLRSADEQRREQRVVFERFLAHGGWQEQRPGCWFHPSKDGGGSKHLYSALQCEFDFLEREIRDREATESHAAEIAAAEARGRASIIEVIKRTVAPVCKCLHEPQCGLTSEVQMLLEECGLENWKPEDDR